MATTGKPKRVRFNQRLVEVAEYLEAHQPLPHEPTIPAVATTPGGPQTLDLAKYAAILEPVFRRQRLSKLAELDPEHPDPVKAIDILNKMDKLYAPEGAVAATIHITFTDISFSQKPVVIEAKAIEGQS